MHEKSIEKCDKSEKIRRDYLLELGLGIDNAEGMK